MLYWLAISAALAASISATPASKSGASAAARGKRQISYNESSSLVVDLGYEQYQGVADASTGFKTWKGIRYAAPPTGSLRWQPPQPPAANRGKVFSAASLPERCPQSPMSPLPAGFNYTGNEDCLILSVYAPANATNLPGIYPSGNTIGGERYLLKS